MLPGELVLWSFFVHMISYKCVEVNLATSAGSFNLYVESLFKMVSVSSLYLIM